jgi:hypothetical protein
MTDVRCTAPIAFADVVDYWAGELPRTAADEMEEHVFTCAECAHQLAEAEALARTIVAVIRKGRFHSIVTDALLNCLAREGVRIRMYALDPGDVVPCSIWADDDLIVTRIRADFASVDAVTIVRRRASGEEIDRVSGVAVRPGQREIIDAISASLLRHLPSIRVHLTVTARAARRELTLGDYTLGHAGSFDRSSADL